MKKHIMGINLNWKHIINKYSLEINLSFKNQIQMKDLIKRILISLVSGGLLGYLLFLLTKWSVIVHGEFLEYNNIYYVILAVVCLYLFILFGIYPIAHKMSKATLFVFGLALIVIWDTVLVNNPTDMVYVSDLFKLIGVVLTLLAWTNVLVTDKVRKEKADKKVEIIEV